jgi:hypothetical protein
VSFTRTASRLDFRDAAIYGPAVGFKLDGWIDYVRDRADIAGTFVPAYAHQQHLLAGAVVRASPRRRSRRRTVCRHLPHHRPRLVADAHREPAVGRPRRLPAQDFWRRGLADGRRRADTGKRGCRASARRTTSNDWTER